MLSAIGSPLVAGGTAPQMQSVHIRVVRAVFHEGKPLPVGAVVEIPRSAAAGIVASGKAVFTDPPAPPPTPEPTVAEEPVRKPRGKRDAG